MSRSKSVTYAVSLALATACAGLGSAADLSGAPPPAALFDPALTPPSPAGFYFASRFGMTAPKDTQFAAAGGALQFETSYDATSFKGAALGYRFAPVLGSGVSPRVEIEGGFGSFTVNAHKLNGVAVDTIDSFGSLNSITGFASGYFDLDFGQAFGATGLIAAVHPFIGAGLGAANVTLKKQGVSATGTVIDDSDTRFAYHFSAGIGIELARLGIGRLGPLPLNGSTIEIGYRRMQVPSLEFTARDGTTSTTDFSTDMLTVGFRRGF